MKKFLLCILALNFTSSYASIQIPVLQDYSLAQTINWKEIKTDQLPANLVQNVVINSPAESYKNLPKIFFQEQLFTVCNQNCQRPDIFKRKQGDIDQIKYNPFSRWDVIEQTNVYFWVNRYFNFLRERFYFEPNKFLTVITNRHTEEGDQNNAYFDPTDFSLNFLPASKSLFFRLLQGKINRSGFDPSVIAHEASHYFFQQLFPNSLNQEIGGLNEGFADYVANVLLNDPKIGMVMLRGEALRDASSMTDKNGMPKYYHANLEVHDLGERVSTALWKTRALADDKAEFDRMVVDAVVDISSNLYSTVHDYKAAILERLPTVISAQNLGLARGLWEMFLIGEPTQIDNLNFLNTPIPTTSYLGFDIGRSVPTELASQLKIKAESKTSLSIIKSYTVSNKVKAILVSKELNSITTPYWFVFDINRSNLLAIYSFDGKLLNSAEELEPISDLIENVSGSGQFIQDFKQKLEEFTGFLAGKKNDLSSSYKLKKTKVTDTEVTFNEEALKAHAVTMSLKRRFLTAVLGGTKVEALTLFTIPDCKKLNLDLPTFNNEVVIGYELVIEKGIKQRVMLTKSGPN